LPASVNQSEKKEKPIDEPAEPINGPAKPNATAPNPCVRRRRHSPDPADLHLIWRGAADSGSRPAETAAAGSEAPQSNHSPDLATLHWI
jgi:hypothetical protein